MSVRFNLGLILICGCASTPLPSIVPAPEPPAAPAVLQSVPPPATFADWLKAQRDIVEKDPHNLLEVKRLVAMLYAEGLTAELEKILSEWPAEDPWLDLVRDALAPKTPPVAPPKSVKIARAELCRKISGFRRYVPYGDPKFKPGSMVLLYAEFEGFGLVAWGEVQTLHLRYEWELYDEQGRKLSLPAWEKAPPQEKEDRLEFRGAVGEFHQSFGLPLPRNIPGGAYTIRLVVEDQANKKRYETKLPIEIVFE